MQRRRPLNPMRTDRLYELQAVFLSLAPPTSSRSAHRLYIQRIWNHMFTWLLLMSWNPWVNICSSSEVINKNNILFMAAFGIRILESGSGSSLRRTEMLWSPTLCRNVKWKCAVGFEWQTDRPNCITLPEGVNEGNDTFMPGEPLMLSPSSRHSWFMLYTLNTHTIMFL